MAALNGFLVENYFWFLSVGLVALGVICTVATKRWEIIAFSTLYAASEALYQYLDPAKYPQLSQLLYFVSMALLFVFIMIMAIICEHWLARAVAAVLMVIRVFRIYFYYSIVSPLLPFATWQASRPYTFANMALVAAQFVLAGILIVMYILYFKKEKKRIERRGKQEYQRAIDEEKITPPDEEADKAFERIQHEKVAFDVTKDGD